MTIEEAIQIVEYVIHTELKWPGTEETVEALRMALAALRAQQEADRNEPLTLEELLEMSGEPVWTEDIGDEGKGTWEICCGGGMRGEVLWFADEVVRTENYGKTWLAYRHKKEETT